YLDSLLKERNWFYSEMIPFVKTVTIEEVLEFGKIIFKNCLVEVFAHGNITQERALSISKSVKDKLRSKVEKSCIVPLRHIKLNPNSSYVYANSAKSITSAVQVYYQTGLLSDPMNRVLTQLFCVMFNKSFYNELRTEQQ